MSNEKQSSVLLTLTAQIVAAHLQKNSVATTALPGLIEQVYAALKSAGMEPVVVAEKPQPIVPAKRSIFPDYIVCLEDGRKLKTLKRHLRATYDMTPEQYREKWGLPADYPMVAPNYAEHRSRLAKELGLGRKAAEEVEPPAPTPPVVVAKAAPPAPPPVVAKVAPPPPMVVAKPVAAVKLPEIKEPRRVAEPTAASVFAKFPTASVAEPTVAPTEPTPPKGGRAARKPFSKQLARTMRS